MRALKFTIIALSIGTFIWSCQSGPSETDKAYAEMISQTDSIQEINNNLKDSVQAAMSMNGEMIASLDTTQQDSTLLVKLSDNQIIFQEQQASLDKIDAMISDFEGFEAEHDKGEMNEADVKAQVEQIKEEQKEIMDEQDNIQNELDKIRNEYENAMDKMANDTTVQQTSTGHNM